MKSRLYAFYGQSAAVRALLGEAGIGPGYQGLMVVRLPEHLHGLQGGTFAIVQNHPVHVPLEMWQAVEHNGMNVIVLSDEFARAKATERMRA